MAKREEGGGEEPKGKQPKHLHQVISEHITDEHGKSKGVVHHHVYKDHHSDAHSHPPRPMGMSQSPEEAGEHVSDQMQQAWQGGGGGGAGQPAGGDGGGEGAPAGGEGAAPEPEA